MTVGIPPLVERLRMILLCCHPAVSADSRVALCDGHPHLALGGPIELREIEPLG